MTAIRARVEEEKRLPSHVFAEVLSARFAEVLGTLKDHKPNFANSPTCRLINLQLYQWKNTKAVLSWFNNIQHKDMYSFIAFDVVEFYPSISIKLLSEALQFASEYDTITNNGWHITLQAKSSLLYSYGEPWGKKT